MWRRVGEDEANPSRETISHVSPLARALLENALANVLKPGIVMQRYETSDDL
jgi:transcription elongation GreA/GreB family factor